MEGGGAGNRVHGETCRCRRPFPVLPFWPRFQDLVAAIWVQPPGVPRSTTTRAPGFRKWNFPSTRSLKAAREW